MPRPRGSLSHADTFRHSVPIRLAAYWVLTLGCTGFALIGLYPFSWAPMLGLTASLTLALALLHRAAIRSRSVATLYLALEGLAHTAIFHFCGELRLAVAPIVYTFELLNPGLRLGRVGHFAVANGFAALFTLLVVGEQVGLVRLANPAPWPMASVLIVFLELNVAAVFISEMRRVLEDRAIALAFARDELYSQSADLERRVVVRTAELEASYRALQDQASEHRTFVYAVTHDLKAPLNAILLRADRLSERDGMRLATESRADLGRIMALAERGESMLRDLMAHFEVSESPEPREPVDLGAVVRRALEPLEHPITTKGIGIEVSPLPTVHGQPQKLTHVFANLLGNAVRFVPPVGGAIRVEAQPDGDAIVVCVQDNGPGIPVGYTDRIFQFFARVPVSEGGASADGPEGNGLGLAIVRRIVEQHRGRVWVESSPGHGSRFFVRLPVGAG